MSKYEELKEKLEDADDYIENCGCDSCEHTRKDIRAFECAAASLIERAAESLKQSCANCRECSGCCDDEPCDDYKLLAEMEAIWRKD